MSSDTLPAHHKHLVLLHRKVHKEQMKKYETNTQIIDVVVVSIIFSIACVVGKAVTDGSWISFYGLVFAVMAVRFGLRFGVRRRMFRRMDS